MISRWLLTICYMKKKKHTHSVKNRQCCAKRLCYFAKKKISICVQNTSSHVFWSAAALVQMDGLPKGKTHFKHWGAWTNGKHSTSGLNIPNGLLLVTWEQNQGFTQKAAFLAFICCSICAFDMKIRVINLNVI